MKKIFSCPAVSVVIPMYNAEKYIGECLDSILVQTFKNFEVIVVDDCSTDSSYAIVENYKSKFGERIKLFSTEFNADTSGAVPRNKGITFSRGEYILFVDADDLITKTALEELYPLAKKFDADVVYCEKSYKAEEDLTNVRDITEQKGDFVEKPTLETEDFAERVKKLLQTKFWVSPISKLVRRDFLLKHEIFFPLVRPREDDIWNYGLIFHSKNFLRVPNKIYIVRLSKGSVTRKDRTPLQKMNFWLSPIFDGLKAIDQLMNKFAFFKQNPEYRYALLNYFLDRAFSAIFDKAYPFPPFVIYDMIKQEFGNKFGEYDVLICALCTALNTQQKINFVNQQQFQQFFAQVQEREKQFNQFAAQAQAQVNQFNQFAAAANKRIAELEAEVKRLQS